ncbi:conidiation-specific protein 6 [Xylariaceae sp. FL0804]|nr:conidiation-specific protein 6 [Xylariaceae sp. FL0804]
MADEARVAAGHKSAINNPNTSEEAKQHSKEVLENEIGKSKMPGGTPVVDGDKDPANVARGLKSAINNPNVSEEAKDDAQERLEKMEKMQK